MRSDRSAQSASLAEIFVPSCRDRGGGGLRAFVAGVPTSPARIFPIGGACLAGDNCFRKGA